MKRWDNKLPVYVTAVVVALVLALPMTRIVKVEGQGGDPRNAKPSSTPPSKSGAPARKPNAPAFRPQNPNIELVRIPPGNFMMGTNGGFIFEKPVHQVTINYSFYMGRYEVTQRQWLAVMGNNPSSFKDCDNCPVEQVSWNDAQNFIRRLNQMRDGYTYRFPTEAEWEYACRAGTTGDYAGDVKEMAWSLENSGHRTHAVGSKRSNGWGLADMSGNVGEWCEDLYQIGYDEAPSDGSAYLSHGESRVLRGGSWEDDATSSTFRYSALPDKRSSDIGFRVVAVAPTK